MAETYPPVISTFTVTGRLVRGVADSADPENQPDVTPIAGVNVTFSPDLDPPIFRVPGSTPPLTVFQESIVATTDADGYLRNFVDSTLGVILPYGLDPDIAPNGWSWRVRISVGGNFPDRIFSIAGTPGGTIDLATVIPVAPNPGPTGEEWLQAVATVTAAADDAVSAKDAAEAAQAATETARDEATVTVNASPADWTGAITLSSAFTRSKYVKRRLTGNVALTVSPGVAGVAYSCTLELAQDPTGGRSVTLANVATPYGVPIPLSTAPNAVDVIRLEWNGTRWAAFLAGTQLAIPTAWVV
ncbi:hypothetical protein MRBLMI12_000417 [Microbacterium sp. LMI12-1-1.1]|uniref:hypothetical protein n=1 Tax=Microbacterium sp. LMI12-1-1.1 TaxID=3135225 RepID=UPI003423CFB5